MRLLSLLAAAGVIITLALPASTQADPPKHRPANRWS